MNGKVPYVDFIDVNPPLIMYLSALVVLLARSLRFHPVVCFNILVMVLVIGSTLGLRSQLRLAWGGRNVAWYGFMGFLWAGCSWGILEFVQFGQREHLFLLAAVPFLLLRSRRWEGASPAPVGAAIWGAFAGLGAALKPYFVLAMIFPELWWVCSRRRVRPLLAPETLSLCGTGLAYAVHFLWLPAVERDAFFDRWMPFFMRHYDVYRMGINEKAIFLFVGTAVAALFIMSRGPAPFAVLSGPLLALAAGGMAASLVSRDSG